jgi:acetyl esterase/lipase
MICSAYRKQVFTLEYRLSVGPPQGRHPFPTALIDALAGYNYLVNVLGFSPSNIIIVGDSAGGNLALALIRYLVEYQMSPGVLLPSPPGFLALLSPWADIGTSHIRSGSSEYTNSATDILSNDQLDYCRFAFMGPHGIKAIDTNEYISPASLNIPHVSFVGFPRTFIVSGGAETLLDQIRTLRDRMVKDLGSAVIYYEGQDGIHNYPCFHFFEPLRSNTLGMIGRWITAP